MYYFLIAIHVIASLMLILVILLQAGRGGGLADNFGGAQAQSIFGTKTATVLTKATSVAAIIFLSTSLILAVASGHRARSLMAGAAMEEQAKTDYEEAELPKSSKEKASK